MSCAVCESRLFRMSLAMDVRRVPYSVRLGVGGVQADYTNV